ncbi:hypothetical protein [Paenibacillus timonensis]|jgi:hypothetical protein|uniref:hypothetical protein n=1 Tax=Paenibacillus timonensis TaxID=225915 RepID=UPI001F05F2CF|nr:hypothetical protein [Paenibacillus timonensis]
MLFLLTGACLSPVFAVGRDIVGKKIHIAASIPGQARVNFNNMKIDGFVKFALPVC